MRKIVLIILSLLLVGGLISCSKSSDVDIINKYGKNYKLNTVESTISDDEYIYNYTFSGDRNNYSVEIIYPDKSEYRWQAHESSDGIITGSGGWSDDYDKNKYVDGDILRDILEENAPKKVNGNKLILGIIVILIGIFNFMMPEQSWYLSYGWRFKDVEPSDTAIGFTKISGGVAVLVGILIMIFI